MAQDAFSFSLTSPDPASFFHFHFSPIEYLILSSSCLLHREIAGLLGGWGGTAQCVKCLLSLRIFICTPRTCVKQKVLCAVSVFLLEWESDTGQSPEAWGPVSQAYAATSKRPQKDKGEKTRTQVSDHSNTPHTGCVWCVWCVCVCHNTSHT